MMQAFGHDVGGGDRPFSPAPLPRFSDDTEPLRVMQSALTKVGTMNSRRLFCVQLHLVLCGVN
jgi:hypothetical protein